MRSTVATYAGVHDELRKLYARSPDCQSRTATRPASFSYNTGNLRCPVCDGTGVIDLDVQFLPDVEIPCPECHGSRYAREADQVQSVLTRTGRSYSLPDLMERDMQHRPAPVRRLENRSASA